MKKIVKVGNLTLANKHIIIQSMLSFSPSKIIKSIRTIKELEKAGCEIIRVSVLNNKDAEAIKTIKKHIHIPVVADIHYSSELALSALQNNADAIRINPGNFPIKELIKIIKKAKEVKAAIRIGVNSGSINKKYASLNTVDAFKKSIKEYVDIMEKEGFENIVLSAKSTDINETIKINEMLDKEFSYPLHIGLTEAGDLSSSLIKSTLALAPLINKGIGETIRISINGKEIDEVIAAKTLLKELNKISAPTLIACPTCGRCQINSSKIVQQVKKELVYINKDIKVAVMGCVVNGLGEGKNADIGIAGGKHKSILFKKGKQVALIPNNKIVKELIKEIKKS